MTRTKANVVRTSIMALAISNPTWGITLEEKHETIFGTTIQVTTEKSRIFQAMGMDELSALCRLAKGADVTSLVTIDEGRNALKMMIA